MFARRELAETCYRLRLATHRTWDAGNDDRAFRLRRVVVEPASPRVDRAFVAKLVDAAQVPIVSARGWQHGRIGGRSILSRIGDEDMLPDVCLWSFAWYAAFNGRVPTWGIASMQCLWRHAGGAIKERFTLDEVWPARQRLLGGL